MFGWHGGNENDGNRVNTACRMESSSEAFVIHITEATRNLLVCLGVLYCEERGLTQIKVHLLPGVFFVAMYGIK